MQAKGPFVLSHFQTRVLERAWQEGRRTVQVSLDLGLSTVEVTLSAEGVVLPDGQQLPWAEIEAISAAEAACFTIENQAAEKIQFFSEFLSRAYSLLPTPGAPTMLVSGVPMHRIKGTDPYRDTRQKIRAVSPLRGRVLDICTGLGYTAIEAAKTAEEVVTIELDPTALEVARLNPWSRPLFDNPRIRQIVGDAFDEVQALEPESFACIIHDPPMLSLAGDLYSGEFYRRLWRLLERRGRMFHYVGDPDSRSGRNITRGVVRRLQEAGFRKVVRRPRAFGLVAYK